MRGFEPIDMLPPQRIGQGGCWEPDDPTSRLVATILRRAGLIDFTVYCRHEDSYIRVRRIERIGGRVLRLERCVSPCVVRTWLEPEPPAWAPAPAPIGLWARVRKWWRERKKGPEREPESSAQRRESYESAQHQIRQFPAMFNQEWEEGRARVLRDRAEAGE